MFISSFHLLDYKSYIDSGALQFSLGINLVVGQNDAGKSALLEGLSLNFSNKPHRSSGRGLTANAQREQESTAEIQFTVGRDELWDILRSVPGQFEVPLPENHVLFEKYDPHLSEHSDLIKKYGLQLNEGISDVDCARICILNLLDKSENTFRVCYKTKDQPHLRHVFNWLHGWNHPTFPALLDYQVGGAQNKRLYAPCQISEFGKLIIDRENEFLDQLGNETGEPFDLVRKAQLIKDREDRWDFGLEVAKILRQRIYLFHAQRTVQGKCRQEFSGNLLPDASNLASFLVNIQSRPGSFREINDKLRTILPQIYEVATHNLPSDDSLSTQGHAGFHEILVYQKEGHDKEEGIPLDDCGTGVGQVLAILSAVIASKKHSRTIIIDEPQSFLHPGAVRKLIDVLKQYPQHQYIISTHSPQLLTIANPSTITLVIKEPGKPSLLKSISPSEQNDLALCLEELGARLSDVFGADQVLWVEGKTEAKCFPLIVEKLLEQPLLGTAIVHVDSTGDLEGKDAERVIKIYEKLSHGAGLVPRTLGFIFDRENRTEPQIASLKKRLGGDRVRFLKRTMIENYFLNAEALTKVTLKLDGFTAENVSLPKVTQWLDERLARKNLTQEQVKRYYAKNSIGEQDQNIKGIHAGHILEDLFAHFSDKQVEYDKPRHGVMLTEWLIVHQSQALNEVKELLKEVLAQE